MQGNDSIKYATSILDYVFRELAVSYMGRFDLAHVDPSESNFDAMGRGVEEGKQPEQPNNKYLSKGLTRSRTDNLVVMRGEPQTDARGSSGNVTSLSSHGATARAGDAIEGAVALKQEVEPRPLADRKARSHAVEQGGRRGPGRAVKSRTPGGSQGQGLRRRDVRRVREFHAGAERHVHEVRYVWEHDGVFVKFAYS